MDELADSESRSWMRFLAIGSNDALDPRLASVHAGQSALVTGAGGFIGSDLVESIAAAGPKRIVLLDSTEQNLFQAQQQPESLSGLAASDLVLGSVDDADLLDDIFTRFHPR